MNRLQRLKMAMLANMEEKGLPSEYRAVAYLQSTGTQYIDTGYVPIVNPTNFIVEIKSQLSAGYSSDNSIFGARYGTIEGQGYKLNQYSGRLEAQGIFLNNNIPIRATNVNKISFISKSGESKLYINDELIINDKTQGVSSTNGLSLTIMALNQITPRWYYHGKIYYCKLTDQDKVVRNLVPCYRKADNVAGMYDLVNDVFYTNAGTGEFIVGGEI